MHPLPERRRIARSVRGWPPRREASQASGSQSRSEDDSILAGVRGHSRSLRGGCHEDAADDKGDEAADAACRQSIAGIVARLTNTQPGAGAVGRSGRLSPINVVVPAHLQDLKEGDLPETQRVAVLDQIAIFRENAARRERDKKHLDDERDRAKSGALKTSGPVGYGYGTRAFPKATEAPRSENRARATNGASKVADPQSYAEPVDFVRPVTVEGKGSSERTDEEEEAVRQQRRERDRALALREVWNQ